MVFLVRAFGRDVGCIPSPPSAPSAPSDLMVGCHPTRPDTGRCRGAPRVHRESRGRTYCFQCGRSAGWVCSASSPSSVVGYRRYRAGTPDTRSLRRHVDFAFATFAWSDLPITRGTMSAAKIARIKITTISSMSVKPLRAPGLATSFSMGSFQPSVFLSAFTSPVLRFARYWQQNGQHDKPTNVAMEKSTAEIGSTRERQLRRPYHTSKSRLVRDPVQHLGRSPVSSPIATI